MSKPKLLNLLLILTSLFGYLEWGDNMSMFVFQGEWEVITKLFSKPNEVIHPFTILPLGGQILLLLTIFQQRPYLIMSVLGLAGLGILISFLFLIGVVGRNGLMVLSTTPFMVLMVIRVVMISRKRI